MAFSINDTDHLRFAIFSPGSDFSKPLETLGLWDEQLDASLDWACSPDLGFLTTRIDEVGAALSCGALIFIPGIMYSSMFERLSQRLLSQGIRLRFYASGGEEDGDTSTASLNPLVEISAQANLGTDENTFISGFQGLLMELVEGERKTRERIKIDRTAELENEAFRSAALLRASKMIDSQETRRLLVALRSGLVYGLAPEIEANPFPEESPPKDLLSQVSDPFGALDRLYVDVGEAQLRFSGVFGKDENKIRAELVRRELPRYLI
jgi:protein arginine kinase